MNFSHLKQILFILAVSLNLCVSLYEDQVGKFDWKHKYVGKVKFSHIDLKSKIKRIFVATESNVVAALSFRTGAILWRQVLELGDSGIIRSFYAGSEVVTLSGGTNTLIVRGWNPASGTLLFEWTIPATQGLENILWSIEQNKVYQIKRVEKGFEITSYHTRSGIVIGSKTIPAAWLRPDSKCVVCGGVVVCASAQELTTLSLSEGDVASTSALPSPSASLSCLPHESVLITTSSSTRYVANVADPPLKLVSLAQDAAAAALHPHAESYLLFTIKPIDGEYQVEGQSVDGERVEGTEGIVSSGWKLNSQPEVSSLACASVDLKPVCYLLLSAADHATTLLIPNRLIWTREEALASVVTVEMMDLPVSDTDAAIEKEFASKEDGVLGMVWRRLASQVGQVRSAMGSEKRGMVRDELGLRKLVVLVTLPGKLYALDTEEKGRVIWQAEVPSNVEPFSRLGVPHIPLYPLASPRPRPPAWLLLFKHKVTGNSVLYIFNPITGQPMWGGLSELDWRVSQAVGWTGGVTLLREDGTGAEVWPPGALPPSPLFSYSLNPSTGELSGYLLDAPQAPPVLLWNAQLGPVIALVSKNPRERVHSQGRVLADRSVLYKYVNPNLIAVATISPDPQHKSVVTVYLIDAVSGRIVMSVGHKRASEPVHIVHSENWVVYSYFSDKLRRTEVVSLDLYEGKTQTNTTAFSSLTQNITPFIERQAYIFPHHIMTMKETITEKGITSKHILVGTSGGSVVEVPWALVDPRRSPEVREEGVLPYMPELALPPEATLSYNHTLPNIRGIHTSPAGLESTSLVLVFGLDIFFTRVAPSKTFDVLKDDFEYWLISAVLVGLASAAYISKRLASRKALRQAWK